MRQALWAAAAFAVGLAVAVAASLPPSDDADRDPLAAASFDPSAPTPPPGAPAWRIGDAWMVDFAGTQRSCWLVVVEADADGYRQGIACADDMVATLLATQIAIFDNAYLGEFTPALAGVDAAGDTLFYDWPLEGGKTWETTYEGERVVVSCAPGEDGGFLLEMGYPGESAFLAYDYDPDLRWWSKLSFASGYEIQITSYERGFEGVVHVADAIEQARIDRAFGELGTVLYDPTFEATAEDDLVVLTISRPLLAGEFYEVSGPTENRNGVYLPFLPGEPAFAYEVFEAEEGTWQLQETGASVGGAILVRAYTTQVAPIVL